MRYLEEIFYIGDYLNPLHNKRYDAYVKVMLNENDDYKINTFSSLRETYVQLIIELHC